MHNMPELYIYILTHYVCIFIQLSVSLLLVNSGRNPDSCRLCRTHLLVMHMASERMMKMSSVGCHSDRLFKAQQAFVSSRWSPAVYPVRRLLSNGKNACATADSFPCTRHRVPSFNLEFSRVTNSPITEKY